MKKRIFDDSFDVEEDIDQNDSIDFLSVFFIDFKLKNFRFFF